MDKGSLFVLLDFDRTLADTDRLKMAFDETVFEVRRDDSQETDSIVVERFLAKTSNANYLLPGAKELLRFLDDFLIAHGILTYGDSVWQELKLRAARLDQVPYLITDDKAKGRLISSWNQEGVYRLPAELGAGEYQHLMLVDDRIHSFEGASADLIKVYCGQKTEGLTSDVIKITELRQVIGLIRADFMN